jgi:ubiquinone/menaquinone biosynthesis C-methylase UbiE
MLASTINEVNDGYILGRTSNEYQRLHLQALKWESITLRVLQQMKLKPGMHCLDAGSGTGDVMRLIGNIVTKTGSVTGLDIDKKLGEEGLGVLRNLNDSNYYFQQFDFTEQDLEEEKYDFVFSRFLLIHMTNPGSVLKKLFKALKRGGILLIQDYDLNALKAGRKLKHLTDFMQYLDYEVFVRTGKDPEMGTHLPEYFMETIGAPDGTDASGLITPFKEAASMMKAVAQALKPTLLNLNITTEDKLNKFFQELDNHAKEENVWGLWPMLNSAWKMKE